ncbi:MAG: PEP/pyruvate-binding domain-containing protein [Candidatus Zixiibacteriota bacterium]
MNNPHDNLDNLIWFLKERQKELNCLYTIEEILSRHDTDIAHVCEAVIKAIPPGWQYPEVCDATITLNDKTYQSPGFVDSPWRLSAPITVGEKPVGRICVYYTHERPVADDGPFLKEEAKLIRTIADRFGHYLMYSQMKHVLHEWQTAKDNMPADRRGEWRVVLDLLRETDKNLYLSISHKMLNHLCWSGVEEAKKLVRYYSPDARQEEDELLRDSNIPHQRRSMLLSNDFLSDETFQIASDHMSDDEILAFIQGRIQEDKLSFLVRALNRNLPLTEIADAIRRYHRIAPSVMEFGLPTLRGVHAALIRRFFSEQMQFVNVAKNYIEIEDFYKVLQNIIFTAESSGKLGGKSAGLYLAASILRLAGKTNELLAKVKTPKTWYITSDALMSFMHYNNLEEIVEQKYKEIDQVRLEYPHVVQTFKNSHFPPEILKGLSVALDDLGDRPLIVRSSSLLEDRMGSAFSGKYKSLFLANQGDKKVRLEALTDAIAEVYASTFGPDPIEYRAERNLLDFYEEMGIMIQEVVGTRIGDYFLPAYAGVAFSHNEFRWSPRIKREDGLLRLVPGLGTRAVDRLSDDYPVLIAPGQPGLRVNVTIDEAIRYSPKKADLINLRTNRFETVEMNDLIRQHGNAMPNISEIVSLFSDDHLHSYFDPSADLTTEQALVTFEGLLTRTSFVKQIQAILRELEEKIGTPVDIEFACDGQDFYLLQCRPQSSSEIAGGAVIPHDLPTERVVFSANRYVSNGRVPDITHIVYVDPQKYNELTDRSTMLEVGRVIGRLNKVLPKRQFILMGPGRWGSRGDIKLGVSVTYSDINNTASLVEIARKKGNYTPDLSFGTHFFQDLVEANIRYLPLYPDEPGVMFNEVFLTGAANILRDIVPEYEYLSDTVRLIDIPSSANGQVLQLLMNADLDQAIAVLAPPRSYADKSAAPCPQEEQVTESAWRWRLRAAEHIASQLDPQRFGVKGLYIFGSTKNATAGPRSDIDLLIHVGGTDLQCEMLKIWLEGWSLALDDMNYRRTGYKSGGLLDVHIITDDDIARKTSYAAKINAVTDAARPLQMSR